MLRLKQLQAYYGKIQALYDVDIHVEPGRIVTLIGANGAGKSTTLMAISGVVACGGGEIIFDGRPIHNLRPDKIVAAGISQVPEGRHIFPELTVMENLEMGAFLRKDRDLVRKDLEYVFELFPLLAERRKQQGGTLSGGEQQMLAISRALMARPKLLLLDEPSLGLAPLVIKKIFAIIERINQEHNTTIFLVEQNANLALRAAHQAYVMENGRVTMSGKASDLLADEGVRAAYLGFRYQGSGDRVQVSGDRVQVSGVR